MTDQHLTEDLTDLVEDIVGTNTTIEVLRAATNVTDSTTILRIADQKFRCVLQISPVLYPEVVAEAGVKAKTFASAIGLSLASPMLLPIAEGRHQGRSFAILPYRSSFSRNKIRWPIQRAKITPAVLDWLARLAGRADVRNDNPDDLAIYKASYEALLTQEGLDLDIRAAAEEALSRLERQELEPRICPMHGDLWLGNILRGPAGYSYPFSVIDWRGSAVRGFPIFDLVRLAMSYRISSYRLGRELKRHAEIMGCSTLDTYGHLLAALGHYAINRGEMPLNNFLRMAKQSNECHRTAVST